MSSCIAGQMHNGWSDRFARLHALPQICQETGNAACVAIVSSERSDGMVRVECAYTSPPHGVIAWSVHGQVTMQLRSDFQLSFRIRQLFRIERPLGYCSSVCVAQRQCAKVYMVLGPALAMDRIPLPVWRNSGVNSSLKRQKVLK